ncbi:MAG TPA: (Fe-S)-binding protein [Dehalococcoidia bacterium]|nr:(Fe-S)-binding protein [Dehalococcoidia bacterium]
MALEDYLSDAKRCCRCSYCKWIPLAQVKSWRFAKGCPSIAYKNFHSYSAGGRLAVVLSLSEGRSSYTDGLLDVVYQCQMDGSCDVACKICRYHMEPLEAMRELRFKLVEEGQLLPQHIPVIDNLRKEDNMVMKPKAERGKWSEDLDIKDLTTESAEVVFHGGCQLGFDEELGKVARTAVTLLKNAGVDIGIIRGKEENCCGGKAYDMGYRGEFIKYAENNIEAWTRAGVKTVVTSCSDGYFTFKRLYPDIGSKFEVLHTVEFIDRLIKEGRIKFNKTIPMTVTYHDPCHLGRLGEQYIPWQGEEKKIRGQIVVYEPSKPRNNGAGGIYEPPREVLRSIPGLELVEMERIREYAWCCGAGGGVREAYPDFSYWTARERIEEAKSTGAEALVSACPWCERNFIDAVNGNGDKMKVYDVIELVQQAI